MKEMEKKKYVSPTVRVVEVSYENCLLDWSAPKGTGGGNVPEGKANDVIIDDEEDDDELTELWENVNGWE